MRTVHWVMPAYREYRRSLIVELEQALAEDGLVLEVECASGAERYSPLYQGDVPPCVRRRSVRRLTVLGRTISLGVASRGALGADLTIVPEAVGLLSTWAIVVSRRVRGYPTVVFGHGRDPQRTRRRSNEWMRSVLAALAGHWMAYNEASARDVAQYMRLPHDRIWSIDNSVDLRELQAAAMDVERSEAEITIAFVGNLYPLKQVPMIVRAIGQARNTCGLDIVFDVVGSGADEEHLRQMATTRPWLRYHGPIVGPDRGRVWAAAHIAALPSSTGLAALEAASFGCAIIIDTSCHHGPEVTYLSDRSALMEDLGSSDERLADAIVRLATDVQLRERFGRCAVAECGHLTVERTAGLMRSAIRSILSISSTGH